MDNIKEYSVGDIVAIRIVKFDKTPAAISCKVIDIGVGETKNGNIVHFKDADVIWKLGHNKRWPGFVHMAFRGEEPIGEDIQNAEASGQSDRIC